MHLPPIDNSDYWIAGLAMAQGWAVGHATAIWLALPPWAQTAIQGLVTILFGLGALTAQYFWRRYLRRRWPEEEKTHDH